MTTPFCPPAPTRLKHLAAALLAGGLLASVPAQAGGPAGAYQLTRLGLVGPDYTDPNFNSQQTYLFGLNAAGQAAGVSTRNSGGSGPGNVAWLYSGGSTQAIGLTGVTPAGPLTAYRGDSVSGLNAAGQVAGTTERIAGYLNRGKDAWVYSGGATQVIGLTDGAYTVADTGYRDNSVVGLNNAGQVAGSAKRYVGGAERGSSAWLYSGGTTLDIGLSGYGYTHTANGYQNSQAVALNGAGQVAGTSERYIGTNWMGQAAWRYSGGTTQLIGLTDAAHTQTLNGYQVNSVRAINAGGQVVGTATRYGTVGGGTSAWLFDGTATQAIGLTDAAHVSQDTGQQVNEAVALNDAGQVAGVANRYSGGNLTGQDSWLYTGGTARQIGLTGSGYETTSGNWRHSEVVGLNQAGQVAGLSWRYAGDTGVGSSAWLYDDDLDVTYDLTFSVSSSGQANSEIDFLGDDGLVLGHFEKYNGAYALGTQAFAWTAQGGMVEVGGLVTDGLGADWLRLRSATAGNSAGQIAGAGFLSGNGMGAYLMTPVPEPEGYALLLAGLGVLRLAARRRNAAC